MKVNDRIVNIIEDHARVCDVLSTISYALEEGSAMPNYLPCLNDAVVTDQLSKICEHFTDLRKKLL